MVIKVVNTGDGVYYPLYLIAIFLEIRLPLQSFSLLLRILMYMILPVSLACTYVTLVMEYQYTEIHSIFMKTYVPIQTLNVNLPVLGNVISFIFISLYLMGVCCS